VDNFGEEVLGPGLRDQLFNAPLRNLNPFFEQYYRGFVSAAKLSFARSIRTRAIMNCPMRPLGFAHKLQIDDNLPVIVKFQGNLTQLITGYHCWNEEDYGDKPQSRWMATTGLGNFVFWIKADYPQPILKPHKRRSAYVSYHKEQACCYKGLYKGRQLYTFVWNAELVVEDVRGLNRHDRIRWMVDPAGRWFPERRVVLATWAIEGKGMCCGEDVD
jgi:hypothetical protein